MTGSGDVGTGGHSHPGGQGQPSVSYTGGVKPEHLAQTLSELARTLQLEESLDDTLTSIVAAAVPTIPGTAFAGLTVVQGKRSVWTRAATHELARRVDQAQYDTGQGPCLDAVFEHRTVRVADLTRDTRWPDFAGRAAELGVRGMLSFQLYVEHDNLGALNLYSPEAGTFDDESEQVGLLFAAHAAVAMAGARREYDLGQAIGTRDLIGQAKGILMERYRLTADQAFVLLVRTSQHTNVKVSEVARILAETGELGPEQRRAPAPE
ncbi:GAF and ANTAR domain-containing protein [Micromonospora sp. WMMD1102]|uniref:GAF and ANTAR domain-containing protein n=1 Tax=Micromonospora sp. WMMD1102 TaxID=3016105 RepID=UPI0024150F45|nr:GAF and ANTAR domain-containing protein [Micromonospora sp. WMMD1102]MDG4791550.1 GAF and ANTAR domain-containing protein [Micromonospora sp. WMMD1102]